MGKNNCEQIKSEFEKIKKILISDANKAESFEDIKIIFLTLLTFTTKISANVHLLKVPAKSLTIPKQRGEDLYIKASQRDIPSWEVSYVILKKFFQKRDKYTKLLFNQTNEDNKEDEYGEYIIERVKDYTEKIVMQETKLGEYLLKKYHDNEGLKTFSDIFKYNRGKKINYIENAVSECRKIEILPIAKLEELKKELRILVDPSPPFRPQEYTCVRCTRVDTVKAKTPKDFKAKVERRGSLCVNCIRKKNRDKQKEKQKFAKKTVPKELIEKKVKKISKVKKTNEELIREETCIFIKSKLGKNLGLDIEDTEEVIFLVLAEQRRSRCKTIKECIEKVFTQPAFINTFPEKTK